MSLLVCVPNRDNTKLLAKLQKLLPQVPIQVWPNITSANDIEVVLAWNAPSSLWSQLPNLKLIQSYGAGVDSIELARLPEHVDVARIVDSSLGRDMAEYVLTHLLAHKLRLKTFAKQQADKVWKPKRAMGYDRVGILGFGQLGQVVAERLLQNNFVVSAWSNSPKNHKRVQCFDGSDGLEKLVQTSDYLVCLLPLTPHTEGILNAKLFSLLPTHALLLNVARGKHVVENDLLDALNNDDLAAAILDVFSIEPLPEEHPFWLHEKITITPHAAALTCLDTAVTQIVDNVLSVIHKKEIINRVDKSKGY
ncbi:D-3-phosphoglycerate dehydrogenase [Pseudoalteromonas luteoviolacea B = ATCC 29581]|nr:D-3-phosphoglycerate dehydrogenase [Pseudoalteromonas luteoviolacea B = ATCC 29581]